MTAVFSQNPFQFDIMNPRRVKLTAKQAKEMLVSDVIINPYEKRVARHFARQYHVLKWFDAPNGLAKEVSEKYPSAKGKFKGGLRAVIDDAKKAKNNPIVRPGMELKCTISIGVHDSFDFSSCFYKFGQKVSIPNGEVAGNYNSLIAAMNQLSASNEASLMAALNRVDHNHKPSADKRTWLPASLDILNPFRGNITAKEVKKTIASAILSGETVLELARYFAIQHGILDWFNATDGLAQEIGKISPQSGESFKHQLAAFDNEYYPIAKEGTNLSWKIVIRGEDIPSCELTHWNVHICDKQMADAYNSLLSIMTMRGDAICGWRWI